MNDDPIELEAQINLRPRSNLLMTVEDTMKYTTLTDILESNRGVDRAVTYIEGENAERRVSFGEVHARALGILHHLQAKGAQRGDKMIIFLSNNEQFLDAFWAAIAGGIVPVPLAVGISDEHRHKLLRVARKIGRPFALHRLRRISSACRRSPRRSASPSSWPSSSRAASWSESISDISRPGEAPQAGARRSRLHSVLLRLDQRAEGRDAHARQPHRQHRRGRPSSDKYTESDIGLSWMPLTHDMGLIGFYLILFAYRSHINLMPTDLFVRRPLLWLQLAAKKRATLTSSPNFGYRHFLKVLGGRRLENVDLSCIRGIYNGAEPISVALVNEFMQALAYTGLKHSAMYPVYGLAEACLAVAFPEHGADYRWIRANRHKLGVGSEIEVNPADSREVIELMCVGRPLPNMEAAHRRRRRARRSPRAASGTFSSAART